MKPRTMKQRMVMVSSMLLVVVMAVGAGGPALAGDPLDPQESVPDDPGVCVIVVHPGGCTTGFHMFTQNTTHGLDGSVFGMGVANSRITYSDELHNVRCQAFLAGTDVIENCSESGEEPDVGTVFWHRCHTNRSVVGIVVCSVVHLE